MNKFKVSSFGCALGITWSLYVIFLGITSIFGWGMSFVDAISSLYVGYSASIVGIIIGGIWAFVDGYIGGVIFAWVYNKLAK